VEGFEMVKLGDIAKSFTFGYGIKSADFGEYGMPIIKTKNFKENEVLLLENNPRTTSIYKDEYRVKKGDLLVVIDGACGDFGFWNNQEDGWLNQHVAKIEFNNEITKKFVYYSLFSTAYRKHIEAETVSTTIAHMPRDTIKNYKFPLPSIERQQQIVEAIDGWAVLAQHEEVALKILEKQVMFQVKEMGRGKARVKLETIAKDITFGFMVASGDYGTDGVPVIKTKNIKSKRLMYPAEDQKIKTKLDEKYKIQKGDMMIVLGGSPGENGIWEFDEEAWLNQDCAKISIENPITKMYVFYSLNGQAFDEYIESNTTKTTIAHISRGVVREIEIPLPPLSEQQTLQAHFDEIQHKHAKIAMYKAKAQEAIQRLIPGAS
jgi:hypothetical protein